MKTAAALNTSLPTHLPEFVLLVSWAEHLFQFFRRLGPLGIFVFSALDSSFFFLAVGNDLLLIALIANPNRAQNWLVYVGVMVLGSIAGVLSDDLISRKAGEEGLERFASAAQVKKLKPIVKHSAGWTLLIASMLPPPFPFTIVVAIAAALQYARYKLLSIVFAGRLLRFLIIGALALEFGPKLAVYADSRILHWLVYAIVVASLVGSAFAVIRFYRTK